MKSSALPCHIEYKVAHYLMSSILEWYRGFVDDSTGVDGAKETSEDNVWKFGTKVKEVIKDYVRNSLTIATLKQRLPIVDWLPKYKFPQFLVGDGIAGLTVGFTVIPQGIAYATLAGLHVQVMIH